MEDRGLRYPLCSIFDLQSAVSHAAVYPQAALINDPDSVRGCRTYFSASPRVARRHCRAEIRRYGILCAEGGARPRTRATRSRPAYMETVHHLDRRYPPPRLRHIHVDGTADHPRDCYST